MRSISLTQNWTLSELPLESGVDAAEKARLSSGKMQIPSLPCDVSMALEAAGRIKDPLVGLNSFDCEWIENRSWWFRKVFTLREEDIPKHGVELFIESLDLNADILLNGEHIGHHENAFRPFVRDVRPWLKAGENELLIRLTTGVETVRADWADPIRDFVAAEYRSRRMGRGNELRTCLRKPQHVFGWDQSPHLATCAICGDVRLDLFDEIAVRDIRFETLALSDAGAEILAEVEVDNRNKQFGRDAVVDFALLLDGRTVHEERRDLTANAGHNYLKYRFTVKDPALWWPNGYGAQPLYTVRVKAVNNYGAEDEKEIRTGIRTVALDTSRRSDLERRYAFVINGKRIYAKGMDLIHSDAIHAKITDETQRELLTAARDAHFNMIRIWDGDWYESDYFHELCDEYGIMIFQTFCFACGLYPDHIEEFRRNVELEAAYQLKRLRSHPCMALWCGNGECLGFGRNYMNRHYDQDLAIYPGGHDIYGEILPRLHSQYVASVPYQCGSPFGDFGDQETNSRGDQHFYPFLSLDPRLQQFRISTESFDGVKVTFIAECGVMGPPSAESLIAACGGRENVILPPPEDSAKRVTSLPAEEIRKMDFTPGGAETLAFSTADRPVGIFEHHRNTFERWAVLDGVYKHYTGERQLSVEEYCLLGGLFQGELLAHAADCIRISPDCGGSLLWCLDDCFGEVGFSLMNHERTPKPAYYFLKHAYEPNRLILRREGDKVLIRCANDRPENRTLSLTCGYAGFDGKYSETTSVKAELPAFAHESVIGSFPIGEWDLSRGVIYVRSDDPEIGTVLLRTCDFRALELDRKATLTLSDFRAEGKDLSFTVHSDGFAHCVHFNLTADKVFSDLYFDLLPGESRRVTFFGGADFDREKLIPDCVIRG